MKGPQEKFDELKYFKPTKRLRQYLMLEALAAPERHTTQRQIAGLSGISPAVVNQYLGEFQQGGLVGKSPINQRDYSYTLRPKGRQKKKEMMVEYVRETFRLFSTGKAQLAAILQGYAQEYGLRRIIFYTAGEVTELLLHSLGMADMELLAIVDDDPEKQGQELFGYPIIGQEEIEHYSPDAVIITTFRYRAEIHEKVKYLEEQGVKVFGF